MPWCPQCKTEYRDGYTTCGDCGSELVKEPVKKEVHEADFDKEAFLVSAGNNFEADMVEALLNANGIPVLKKYGEAGDYLKIYMGGTNFGVDLYVPSKLLQQAQDILKNTPDESEYSGSQDDETGPEDNMSAMTAGPIPEVESTGDLGEDASSGEDGDEEPEFQEDMRPPEEEPADREAFDRKRRYFTGLILLFVVPGLIWVVIALFMSLYQWLSGR